MLIDAHQHFWRVGANGFAWPTPDLAAIYRDFGPDDLATAAAGLGLDGSVLVQSQPDDADTDWLLRLAGTTPAVRAVVGWADLAAPGAPARIAALAGHTKLRGLRPMLQNLPDDDWIAHPRLAPAIAAMIAHRLSLDALVFTRHLPALERFARAWPALPIVIDHAAKPAIGGDAFADWAAAIARLAALPQVHCKLSGLPTEAPIDAAPAMYGPYIRHLVASFGPDRLMWGSDWPVVTLAMPYPRWAALALELTGLSGAALDAVRGGTAARFYRF